MTDVTPEYLLNILDADTARRVWNHLRGVRIYFPKCRSRDDEIRTIYAQMSTARAERIKRLSELQGYNKEVQKVLEELIYTELAASIATPAAATIVPSKLKLSEMLYKNADRVAKESLELLHQGIKAKRPIRDISKKLYDGYDFNDKEVLDVKKKLPKYLQRELKRKKVSKELTKYVDNIKTKHYKTALKALETKLNDVNQIGLEKALKVVLEEKNRYYADRIAKTESHRARNLSRADAYMKDDEVELVKYEMSSRHAITDICDFYEWMYSLRK